MRNKYRGDKVGYLFWRATWYSICSAHQISVPTCSRCMAGHYHNDFKNWFSSYFHKHHYKLWFWWVNRPNSQSRKEIEELFPNLKGSDDGSK